MEADTLSAVGNAPSPRAIAAVLKIRYESVPSEMTPAEAGEVMGATTANGIYRAIKSGRLKATAIMIGPYLRGYVIRRDDFLNWLWRKRRGPSPQGREDAIGNVARMGDLEVDRILKRYETRERGKERKRAVTR